MELGGKILVWLIILKFLRTHCFRRIPYDFLRVAAIMTSPLDTSSVSIKMDCPYVHGHVCKVHISEIIPTVKVKISENSAKNVE